MRAVDLSDKTAETIIRALQVMATEPTEPPEQREEYRTALEEFGKALRPNP